MRLSVKYYVEVKFFKNVSRTIKAGRRKYRLTIVTEPDRLFYNVSSLDRKEPDWTATFDGSKTSSASISTITSLATAKKGFDSTAFVSAGIDLPVLGFDYPRSPLVKVNLTIPAESKLGHKFRMGSILSGNDFGTSPPSCGYEQGIVEYDVQDRVISCGFSFNGIGLNLWRLNDYQKYGNLWLPTSIHHEKGNIVGRPTASRKIVSLSQGQNLSMPGATVERDYITDFKLRSCSIK